MRGHPGGAASSSSKVGSPKVEAQPVVARSALKRAEEKRKARRPRKHIALKLDGRDFRSQYALKSDGVHPHDCFGTWDDAEDKTSPPDKKVFRTVLTIQKEALRGDLDDGTLWAHIAQLRSLGILHDAFCDVSNMLLVYNVDSVREQPVLSAGLAVTEEAVANWVRSVMSLLQRCHEQGVLLGTTSLDRVVGSSIEGASLIGIGVLGRLSTGPWALHDPEQVEAGTLVFTAPELLDASPGAGRASPSDLSDAWTMGMLIYSLLQGGPPVDARRLGAKQTRRAMISFVPTFEGDVWQVVSEPCKVLLQGLLCISPTRRWSIGYALRESAWLNPCSSSAFQGISAKSVLNTLDGFQVRARVFKAGDTLWRATRHLAAEGLPRTCVLDLERTFRDFDQNGDGVLSVKEVKEGLARHSSKMPVDLDKLLKELDADKSGDIDINEWIAALLEECDFRDEEALLSAFRRFDTDLSGKISKAELAAALQSTAAWGQFKFEVSVDELFKKADTDGDGQISYAEFINIIRMEAEVEPETQASNPGDARPAPSILERLCTSPCSHGGKHFVVKPSEVTSRGAS